VIDPRPLGLYDSGIGGLSVVREVFAQLPGEAVLYFGDTARVPYGPRPAEEIVAFNREIVRMLVAGGAKLIVIACNTSSALALDVVRAECPVPVVGLIEPGARAAVQAAGFRQGGVAVIATEGTVRSGAYGRAIRALSPGMAVRELACPAFVPLVEAGRWDGPEAEAAVREALAPLLAAPPAALVLGCTHYPHLAPVIARVLGPGVALVNPAAMAVAEAAALLSGAGTGKGPHRFLVSGDPEPFYKLAAGMLPGAVTQVEQALVSGGEALHDRVQPVVV
jgi:glutamate racemase